MRARSWIVPTVLIIALTVVGPHATAEPEAIGAPGVGDPYYPLDGNGGFDVGHYDIRLSYQPSTDLLSGSTTILATATQDLTQFNLDFLLRPSAVLVNNARAEFRTEPGGELVIRPATRIDRGGWLLIVVSYRDTPSSYPDERSGWHPTQNGVIAAGAPHVARWWFPSNDHPTDKASYEVSVAVPKDLEAISGGEFVGTQQQTNGWLRWNWRSRGPQATYLTMLAVGDFEINVQTAPNGQPLVTAYATNLEEPELARSIVERTPEILDLLASEFGPYPWEAQGGVVTPGFGGLEGQTRPLYGEFLFLQGRHTYLVEHELAQPVVRQHGRSTPVARRLAQREHGDVHGVHVVRAPRRGHRCRARAVHLRPLPGGRSIWQVRISDPGPGDDNFHSAIYHRGALTLQALRVAVGDDTFFRILRTWLAGHRHGNASTEDFTALAERLSGQDLTALFQTWLHTTGKPSAGPNETGAGPVNVR